MEPKSKRHVAIPATPGDLEDHILKEPANNLHSQSQEPLKIDYEQLHQDMMALAEKVGIKPRIDDKKVGDM